MTMGHVADGEKIKLRSFCRVWVRESPAYVHFKHVASLIDDLNRNDLKTQFVLWITFAINVHIQSPVGAYWFQQAMQGMI